MINVCKELSEIPFVFAGSGPLSDQTNKVNNIKNVGFKSGKALEKLICEAYLTVYPSEWYENCPFSVMESQMYGTPVLGANIGGIPELIKNGETGELFRSGDKEDLKEKIQSIWNDETRTKQYALNCKKISFDDTERYCQKILKIYKGKK